MFYDFGGALQRADFTDAGDVLAVPLHAKLEILVRVKALRVNRKLCHRICLLCLDLSGELLNLDDDELGWFQRRESDQNIDDAAIDVVLSCRFLIAFDEVSFARRLALKRTL